MSYRKGFSDPLDLPVRCPVCQDGRKDAAAIHTHNLKCAKDGERKYPERRAYA